MMVLAPCRLRVAVAGLVMFAVLAGCSQSAPVPAAPRTTGVVDATTGAQRNTPRGTLRIAWAGEPPGLGPKFGSPGGSALNELSITFNSALTYMDPAGESHPQIAAEIPTIANGGWVINADGTMVTTYKLRPNARWHDGAPLTADDFAFAFRVYSNPEAGARRNADQYMSAVEAPDEHTLVVRWKSPYFSANVLRYQHLDPLPRHLLEELYNQDVATFSTSGFWTQGYVGSGPFRLERWDPGVSITARAFDDWVLGPPRAATLDIRFIADANTILTNLLSGDLDISGHPFFPPQLAAQFRDRWEGTGVGYIATSESRMQQLDLQQREIPGSQPAVRDVRVRQALLTAIDRSSLVELLNYGLGGSVADAYILRTEPIFPEVDRVLSKYPYDPARAQQLFADAGWRRTGADSPLVNAAGQPFPLEIRATSGPAGEQETAFIASNWKAVGVDSSIFIVPRNLAADAEFAANFPGGISGNRPITPDNFSWTTNQIPTPQNRWSGLNRGSFSDAEVDRSNDAVQKAITPEAWLDANRSLHKRMSEVVGAFPLYYPVDVIVARHPITGPSGHFTYPCYSWNIWEWGFSQ